jgi:hypothetical protein
VCVCVCVCVSVPSAESSGVVGLASRILMYVVQFTANWTRKLLYLPSITSRKNRSCFRPLSPRTNIKIFCERKKKRGIVALLFVFHIFLL